MIHNLDKILRIWIKDSNVETQNEEHILVYCKILIVETVEKGKGKMVGSRIKGAQGICGFEHFHGSFSLPIKKQQDISNTLKKRGALKLTKKVKAYSNKTQERKSFSHSYRI